jgi:hypothetical protein
MNFATSVILLAQLFSPGTSTRIVAWASVRE